MTSYRTPNGTRGSEIAAISALRSLHCDKTTIDKGEMLLVASRARRGDAERIPLSGDINFPVRQTVRGGVVVAFLSADVQKIRNRFWVKEASAISQAVE